MKNLIPVFAASEANLFECLASWVVAMVFCGMDFVRAIVRGMAGQTVSQRKEKAMKREMRIFGVSGLIGAVLCATLVLMAGFDIASASAAKVATVEVIADEPVRNGDVVQVVGSGFTPNDEIKVVLLTKLNDKNAVPEDIFLKEFSLQVDAHGKLSGTVRMEGLDDQDSEAELLPCAEQSNVRSSKRFAVVGDTAEPPRRAAKILQAGTVSINDNDGSPDDGYANTSEQINLSGSGWGGTLFLLWQLEYSNPDGTGTLEAQTVLTGHSGQISEGTLSGACTTTSSFDVDARSIKIRVMNTPEYFSIDSNAMEIGTSAVKLSVDTGGGESEIAGTAFTITVTALQSDSTIATDYVGTRSLTWTTDATASPDGTSPSLPSNGDRVFTVGVLIIANGGKLHNSAENPVYIRVDDGTITSDNDSSDAQTINVADGAAMEVRLKTAVETTDGNYDNNNYGSATFQGPTQANPDESTHIYAVTYDDYGNLITPAETGTWGKNDQLTGNNSDITPTGFQSDVTVTFTSGSNAGTTYSGTISFISASSNADATGTITIDDADGAAVSRFSVSEDGEDQYYVYASWTGTSSGDDGTTGDPPTDYDVRWALDQIDTETKWGAATPVGTSGKLSFSAGTWHIYMGGFPAGNKYFAIRTYDDVGNICDYTNGVTGNLTAESYTTTTDYSLPVELSTFAALPDYGKIVLKWRTESEVNNLGFDLYRALFSEGPFEKITERRIEGAGASASAIDYEYVDDEVEEGVTYFYQLESMDYDGTKHISDLIASAQALTAPKKFALLQNFPNPFNPETSITYTLPRATPVRLTIYNLRGQRIRTLVDDVQSVGMHSVIWNGESDSGTLVGSGVYLYKLHAGNTDRIRRMVFLR